MTNNPTAKRAKTIQEGLGSLPMIPLEIKTHCPATWGELPTAPLRRKFEEGVARLRLLLDRIFVGRFTETPIISAFINN